MQRSSETLDFGFRRPLRMLQTRLGLHIDTGGNGRLGIVGIQERSRQLTAAAAAGRNAQLSLQIAHGTGTGCDGFFDVVVGNGVANADKHNVLRVFFRSVLIVCFILKREYK